jgi:hypothetical protein
MIYLLLALYSFMGMSMDAELLSDQKFLNQAHEKNQELLKALILCRPFEMQLSNDLITKNPLKTQVHGLETDERCRLTQTLPHGGVKTCYFTKIHLQQIKVSGQKGFIKAMTDPQACTQTGSNL